MMFKSYFTVAYRNLIKHRAYSLINIIGLAVGLASSIIIVLYAQNELTFDAFHEHADDIYLVYKERHTALGVLELTDTWVPLLPEMKKDYPGIVDGVRYWEQTEWVAAEGHEFEETITVADPALLGVFTFPLRLGDPSTALAGTNAIVLSEAMATKYFGGRNPVGQTITVDFDRDYQVTGVLEPIPQNSSFSPDFVVPFESVIAPDDEEANGDWGGSYLFTFVQLDANTTAEALEGQLPELVGKVWGTEGPSGTQQMNLRLQPLRSFHDQNVTSNTYAYIFLVIALAIILIACINFMNLATARSIERAKEVGMRKALGAARGQLIGQFLGESMLIALVALGLGAVLAYGLLPVFNDMYGLSLTLGGENGWFLLGMLVGLGLLCGLLAGSYPAMVLSRVNPVASLKGGKGNGARGRHLRNGLVVVQFALSIILIVGAGIAWRQVQHMKSRNLNFDRENVVVIPTSLGDYPDPDEAAVRIETIKGELARTGGIASVASSMSVPGRYANANVFAWPEDWEQEDPLRMRWAAVDDRFFETYQMEFLEGRNFSREFATDANEAIILNETAMRAMGWTTAVGKKVRIGNRDQEVVGVVRDFHFESLDQEIGPVLHIYRSTDSRAHNFISVRVASSDVAGTLDLLERRWQSLGPDRAFDYFFIDEDFDRQYQAVENTSALVGYFSILAILIACIGLLGLVSFTVTQRTKEIGVRKVLGASTADIVLLLTRQFTWPVVLANLVAWPLAYWFVRSWLQGFAYRIGIPWGIFLLGGFVAVAIAWLTVGYLSVRAARKEPVVSLRYE